MIIESKRDTVQTAGRLHAFWRFLIVALVALAVLLGIAIFLIYQFPVFTNYHATKYFEKNYPKLKTRYDEAGEENLLPIFRKAAIESLVSNVSRYLGNSSMPSININVDFESWESIKAERAAMLGRRMATGNREFYKASIQYKGKSVPVKIRLKGERTDHIKRPKRWSLRIKTRKGKSLFGMKNFSIQHPQARGYQREAIFHQFARSEGIIPLKFFYVNVSINGERIGMMSAEEVPAKEMLEREGYKEGLLFQLDDSNVKKLYHSVIDSVAVDHPELIGKLGNKTVSQIYSDKNQNWNHWNQYQRLFRLYYNAMNAPIDESTRKKDSSDYLRQRPVATGLLKAVLEGRIHPSLVFDAEKFGRFYGFLAFWGNSHAASYRNLRYYFNPYTYKFEPIAYDSNAYSSKRTSLYPNRQSRQHEVNRILMSDPVILQAYLEAVDDYYELAQSGDLEAMLREVEAKALANLREEFLFLPEMNLSSMKLAIERFKQRVESGKFYKKTVDTRNSRKDKKPLQLPEHYRAPEVVQAELVRKVEGDVLEIHNLFPQKATITELKIKLDGRTSPLEKHLQQPLPIEVDAFYVNDFYSHTDIPLEGLTGQENITISGKVKLATQAHVEYPFEARMGFAAIDHHPLASQTTDQLLARYAFLSFQESANRFVVRAGTHVINDRIIFPESASLSVKPGAKLLFAESAGIIVKGSVLMEGTAELPIIFNSLSQAKGSRWSGFTVLQADERSQLNHVEFRNTGFTRTEEWQLTGAVTFYRSDVDISHTKFISTEAEDALNIVQGEFTLTNSSIEGSRSDGFDADFATGVIMNSSFSQIGGDGIDFSGSDIEVVDSSFNEIHDKAISAGEATEINIEQVEVIDSGTGLAVKDGSNATIKDSVFTSIEYSALMSYNKKNTYGASVLSASGITYDPHELALIAQKGNQLTIDGEDIEQIKIDIEKLYKKGYMKK